MNRTTGSEQDHGRGVIDAFTSNYVQKSARRMIGKFGFQSQDRDDIQQQLFLRLVRCRRALTNDAKRRAYVARTVRRQLANVIRDRQAEKRDYRQTCSLEMHLSLDLKDSGPIRSRDIPSRAGEVERNEMDQLNLRIDVEECISGIPDPRHREFCERLQKDSISQVAKDMDIPRTTLNSWLQVIRRRFETRGLQKYFQHFSSVG